MYAHLLCVFTIFAIAFQTHGAISNFTMAAFNVQIFGKSKMDKPEVVNVLVQIVQRYDIILIQEIRDSSGTAIIELLEQVNHRGPHKYALSISDRLGKTNSKEQYGFLYRTDTGLKVDSVHQYEDPLDVFERPPYSVLFHSDNTVISEFVALAIHTKPDNALNETNRLLAVHTQLSSLWSTDNIVMMGDLNADCSYISDRLKDTLILRTDTRFTWWFPDELDSTVSNTDCAYDRMIMSGKEFVRAVTPGSNKLFRFDEAYHLNQTTAARVSDHYPIEIQLRTREQGTSGVACYHGNLNSSICMVVMATLILYSR